MKNINLFITAAIILEFFNFARAFEYGANDKEMFYSAFLDGYFTEMQKLVDKSNIAPDKKIEFMKELKKRTNRAELENSSWECITKYPISQIVSASIICTEDWRKTRAVQNQDLYEMLKP